jgi:hypothetical protein
MVKTAREFYDEHYSDDVVVMMRDYAKMLTDRMYSEEDLRNAYRWGTTVNHGTKEHFNEWFEQFKKQKDG